MTQSKLTVDSAESILENVQVSAFRTTTKGGNLAIVFAKVDGRFPYIGAYYSSAAADDGEWYPMRWTEDGLFDYESTSLLDLQMGSE